MRAVGLAFVLFAIGLRAQWVPDGVLSDIKQVEDPSAAGVDFANGSYASDGGYVIQICSRCLAAVDSVTPGASHFFIVRAYTLRAMGLNTEEACDVWATSAIAQSPNAARYLNAALRHFATSRDPHAAVRYERIRAAAVRIAELGGLTLRWNENEKRFE